MLLVVVTAVLAFVTIGGLGFVFVGPRESPASKRTKAIIDRPSRLETATKRAERDPNARRKQILKSLKEQEKKQRKASVTLAAKLYQAGLRISPLVFWGISLGLAVFVFGVTTILFGMKLPIAAMLSVGFGLGLPRWVVGFLGKRRAGKFVAAFPDATDIIVRGVKSGLPAHDCLKIIGK
ncbi:MAG: type II secretion system F family protein, partial [Caulobacteraceae bacterium]